MSFPASHIAYLATSEVEPEWENEYNRWYDQEHVPNLMRVPGYLSARRYVAIDGAPKYLALYEIESMEAYASPEHDRAVSTPWRERLQPHYRAQLGFYRQTFPETGVLPGAAWSSGQAAANALLVVRLDIAAEHDEEFEEWYSQEHLPALCGVSGVICGRIFRAIQGSPKHMAMYHLTRPEVQASDEWQHAAATPWTRRMRRLVPQRWRVVYQPLPTSVS